MKLTIDTSQDSHEDIRKVIKMLQHLVGENSMISQPANIFEDSSSFGQESSQPTQSATEQPTSGGIFSIFGNTSNPTPSEELQEAKETEDIPEVIPY